jgi:hypothetical protein
MVVMEKTNNNKCWQRHRKKGILIFVGADITSEATVEISMEVHQRTRSCYTTLGCIYEGGNLTYK